jgi:hypothetical protein
MRLRLIGSGGSWPNGKVHPYRIMVQTGPRESRAANTDEFKSLLSLQPRIAAMAKKVFGDDFVRVQPEQFEEPYLELLLKKGVPERKKYDLEEFRGWLALCAVEPSTS